MDYQDTELIDHRFKVTKLTKNSTFLKVVRITAIDEHEKINIELDINDDIYKIQENHSYWILMTTSLGNQKEDKGIYLPEEADEPNKKKDKYEYVMCGKVYKIEQQSQKHQQVLISFGGLLMKIVSNEEMLRKFQLDQRVFILIMKT